MKKIIVTEEQFNKIFEMVDENAASDVMKNMGYKEPADPWKKKNLTHIDATGLIGENNSIVEEEIFYKLNIPDPKKIQIKYDKDKDIDELSRMAFSESIEKDTRKPFTDSNGLYWVPAPFSDKLYMLGSKGDDNVEKMNESRHKSYGGFQWLKNHQVELTPEEKEYFKEKGVLYWDEGGKLIHKAKAKDEKDGEVFFAFTHRAWQCCPTSQKSEAVRLAKFIKTTS
jgi:hypothetical protein